MGSPVDKKLKIRTDAGEDRISMLADDLIHQIFSYLDIRVAVQTSVLSKRWKFIWTTLPFLYFDQDRENFRIFVDHVFSKRNHNSHILKLKIHEYGWYEDCPSSLKYVNYAISHNVQDLSITTYSTDCEVFNFTSNSLKKLYLQWTGNRHSLISNFWNLPALTNMRLCNINLPNSFGLPSLTTLHLVKCKLPKTVWDLPALISLTLDEVDMPKNINEFFSALVSLQYLTLLFKYISMDDCVISCPQLVYLNVVSAISAYGDFDIVDIAIFAPKLRDVHIAGIYSISGGLLKLDNVNIELYDCFMPKNRMHWEEVKQCYCKLPAMFQGLSSAKILTLDVETIEALSAIYDLLECSPSPFCNLKYVKLPYNFKESSLSGTIKSYLLGSSPNATIVTTLPEVFKDISTLHNKLLVFPKAIYRLARNRYV